MEHSFPLVLGKDFSGEVEALGAGVTDYAVGDRVFGTVTKPYLGDGSFAEYVTVPTTVGIAKLPENVSCTDGAALGLAGAAAHGIIDAAARQPGQTLLVAGATGGVGTQVLQLAAAAGARVIATAHTDAERELVSRLGADVVVDYQADLAAQVRAAAPGGVDAIAHLAGDASVVELVREGGRFASTLVQSPEQVPTQTATVVPVFANPTPETPGPVRGQPGQRQNHRDHPGHLLPRAAPGSVRNLRPRHPGQGRRHHRLIRDATPDRPALAPSTARLPHPTVG